MSNRSRRRLLHEWRTRAIVWAGDSPPDTIQSMEDWNRWHRDAFRFLWREPLRFPDNIRLDAGLINIQGRNQTALFNPLSDPMPDRPEHLLEFGNRNDPLSLWQKTEAAISDALEYLEPARRIARPGFDWTAWAWWRNRARPKLPDNQTEKDPAAEWLHFFEDYPARFYQGLKKLRTGFTAVDQYGGHGSPWFQDHGSAARNILNLDKRITKSWPCRPLELITESELHALLCLAACWWALDDLLGLSEDPKQWPRWELDYIAGLIQDAERWLAEAYRLKRTEQAEAQITAMAPDAERGKEQRDRLSMMGKKAKQESTRYPESVKEKWREHDRQTAKESARNMNDSDRVRAVIKQFKLPESAERTVRRALISK